MQIGAIGLQFPDRAGAVACVDDIEAQFAAIRRETKVEDLSAYSGEPTRLAAVAVRLENLGSTGKEQLAGIGRPSGTISDEIAEPARGPAGQGHGPQFGALSGAAERSDKQRRAVGGDVGNESIFGGYGHNASLTASNRDLTNDEVVTTLEFDEVKTLTISDDLALG
jgi:hypothetical protein